MSGPGLSGWDRYRTLENEVFELYDKGQFDEAVELLRNAESGLAPWRSDLAHMAACVLAAAGRPTEALQELQAALTSGAWWHPRILLEDDDLAPLAELDGFTELVAEAQVRSESDPDVELDPIVTRPSGTPRGVLLALHGAGQDATDATKSWAPAAELGLVVVAVPSSQRNTPTYRSWPDSAIGTRDVKAALTTLSDADRELPLILAGFSAGGRQAVLCAIEGEPRAVGVIAMGPAVRVENLPAGTTALNGTVLLGEEDDDVGPDLEAALARLEGVEVVRIPGLGHAFPEDFDRYLSPAVGRFF
ncbi:alpha/beta hydrolase [Tenggerimyces flavus]|uniref:Serine aminopeptidase domain-containing protein n=1 Tax=Tenggerimyces flavus TaxID=1708749 RepID=A0ABV7YRJ3_9ACTN|nr:alpha/beta hydrolase [Tenggerimyces flavus]MBM7786434.1 putative esterase [Tenggerimyces flavus]